LLRSIPAPLESHALSRLVAELKQLYPERPPPTTTSSIAPNAAVDPGHSGVTPSGKLKDGPRVWRHPSTSSERPHILSRPLPRSALTGKRHVPHLILAAGTPFLQIKKPQPAYLSRVIRDKKERQQTRVDLVNDMRTWWGPLAQAEDAWEAEIYRACRAEGAGAWELFAGDTKVEWTPSEKRERFRDCTHAVLNSMHRTRAIEKRREQEWGRRLWSILMKERELKFQEEGVLVPLMGPNPERKQIMARQRREKKQKIRERLQQAEEEKKAKEAGPGKAKAAYHKTEPHPAQANVHQETATGKSFVVQIES
jgi:hypothetical protein